VPSIEPLPAPPEGRAPWPHRHLLSIAALQPWEIGFLLGEGECWAGGAEPDGRLAGLTIVSAFFEASTRTALSFEVAAKRLGATVVALQPGASSLAKGETLLDTALTLDAMRPDAIVIRHGSSGAPALIAEKVRCPVLNAGDGTHEHPTQALLDALTIRRRKGRIAGLKVAICGDLLHSRVARSNFALLAALGAEVRACAPPTLMPPGLERFGVEPFTQIEDALAGADVVMMLRLQRERMQGGFVPSGRDYFHLHGLTRARLALAAPDALVMHPGPMNRGVEIASDVADDIARSAITEQVTMGVAVRMTCLDVLTRSARGAW
jgi:aspartate carbamoyltransferase catalytic subunit